MTQSALLLILALLPAGEAALSAQSPSTAKPAQPGTATAKPNPVTEAQALTLLSTRIEKDAVYAPMPLACMSLVVEGRSPASFEIAVREKHGGRCGGDPAMAPVLDRFKIDRASGAIGVYDVLEADWYSWAEFKKHRTGAGQ
jgi:hypothetical protein